MAADIGQNLSVTSTRNLFVKLVRSYDLIGWATQKKLHVFLK